MLCECHSCCTLPRVAVHRPDALLLLRSCHDSVARIVLAGSAETQWSHKETFGALGRMLEMLWEVQKAEPKWDAALEWGEASRVDPLGALEAHTMTLLALYIEQVGCVLLPELVLHLCLIPPLLFLPRITLPQPP